MYLMLNWYNLSFKHSQIIFNNFEILGIPLLTYDLSFEVPKKILIHLKLRIFNLGFQF